MRKLRNEETIRKSVTQFINQYNPSPTIYDDAYAFITKTLRMYLIDTKEKAEFFVNLCTYILDEINSVIDENINAKEIIEKFNEVEGSDLEDDFLSLYLDEMLKHTLITSEEIDWLWQKYPWLLKHTDLFLVNLDISEEVILKYATYIDMFIAIYNQDLSKEFFDRYNPETVFKSYEDYQQAKQFNAENGFWNIIFEKIT